MKLRPLTQAIRFGLLMPALVLANAHSADDIERIMVTGQKIDRTVQETAASVAVITADQIEDQNINDLYDALERTPNVSGSLRAGFNIRGIDAFNVSGGGNSYLASVYVDGAPMPYRIIQQGGFSTWDISQVEILRGPQSTIQGRNALAGAVVMQTQTPSYEWSGKARVGYGEYGKRELAAAFGGELVENQLAFRMSAEKNDFDGFVDNIIQNTTSDFSNNETYRGTLLFQPENLEEFEAKLTFAKYKTDIGVLHSKYPIDDQYNNRISDFDEKTHSFTDTNLYSLNLSYDLTDELNLSSISTYSHAKYGYHWDGDMTPQPSSVLDDDRLDKTFSQELRLVFDYEDFSGVIGTYYSKLDVRDISNGQRVTRMQDLGIPQLLVAPAPHGLGLSQGQADAVLSLYQDFDPAKIGQDTKIYNTVTNLALFADAKYEINDKWDLFGGFRIDREKQENQGSTLYTIDNANMMPDPSNPAFSPQIAALVGGLNAQLLAYAENASGVEPSVDSSFNAFLPKLGVSYHWADDMTTSFTVQKGYRSGGVGTNIAKSKTFTYDPEYTWNYELSFRSTWLEDKLIANANLFYVDWTDQQVNVQFSSNRYDSETLNAGSSTVKGFELELSYQVDDEINLYGGLGYSKSEFEDFTITLPTGDRNLAGRSFADAPEWTANIGVNYQADNGIFANINANYIDDSVALVDPYIHGKKEGDDEFDPNNEARTLVNMRLGYQWDTFSVYLIGSNLLDEEYVQFADIGFNRQTLGAPRQFSLRLEAAF